jgi:hypothetical protein
MSTKNTAADLDKKKGPIIRPIRILSELVGYYVYLHGSHLKPNGVRYPQVGGTRRL